MPYAQERAVRLYYDAECGPCRLFARAVEGASGHRVTPVPLGGSDGDRELAGLSTEARFGYAHLLVGGAERQTGADLLVPLVRYTLGRTAGRVVDRIGPLRRSLRWGYQRFWEYRRTRGCAAATFR